jgi:hypothetical protein
MLAHDDVIEAESFSPSSVAVIIAAGHSLFYLRRATIMEAIKILDAEMSRRSLLINAGKCAVGVAGITALASAVPGIAAAKGADYKKWQYKKINPEEAAKIAYENYFDLWCASTVLKGVFDPLAKSVGEPYKTFPTESVRWAHGGMAGWGTVCGTLTGSGVAIGLITGDIETAEAMTNDLMFYYANTVMPVYKPAKAIKAEIKTTTKADTPVCHISVGKWMKAENVAFLTNERAERCARVAATIAYKTAEMLNTWHAAGGKYTPVNKPLANVLNNGITSQNNCTECHGTNVPTPPAAKS